jgi:hypothetical protein
LDRQLAPPETSVDEDLCDLLVSHGVSRAASNETRLRALDAILEDPQRHHLPHALTGPERLPHRQQRFAR